MDLCFPDSISPGGITIKQQQQQQQQQQQTMVECRSVTAVVNVAFAVIILGFLLHLVGFATPAWVVVKINKAPTNTGLWQSCVTSHTGGTTLDVCVDMLGMKGVPGKKSNSNVYTQIVTL
jgi:hypothetical protein